ncbi:hypothetical protein CH295_02500 [Rhodococcus sp. 14-2483-1-2]|nr:hypothetical protein CH295_02500 [Rhodococcus sp. 14-2483-1-2]
MSPGETVSFLLDLIQLFYTGHRFIPNYIRPTVIEAVEEAFRGELCTVGTILTGPVMGQENRPVLGESDYERLLGIREVTPALQLLIGTRVASLIPTLPESLSRRISYGSYINVDLFKQGAYSYRDEQYNALVVRSVVVSAIEMCRISSEVNLIALDKIYDSSRDINHVVAESFDSAFQRTARKNSDVIIAITTENNSFQGKRTLSISRELSLNRMQYREF